MTQGFYEQLGVASRATATTVRDAYSRAVAQLQRRRKALLDQGGDTGQLDLHRARLDEAYKVLSDPSRRRRYDAMLSLQEDGWTTDPDEVWRRASGALVHPAAGAAAELLRVTTTLSVGALPPVPVPGGGGAPPPERSRPEFTQTEFDPHTHPTAVPVEPSSMDLNETAYALSDTPEPPPERPDLRVVDGAAASAPVIVMPTPGISPPKPEVVSFDRPPRPSEGGVFDLDQLIAEIGYRGTLLKEVRVGRGLTLQNMSDTSRISVRYLEAVEADAYDQLPSATFVRGYVREMAKMLDLDDKAVVDGFMRRFQGDS